MLNRQKDILIISHIYPDADGIGSQLALGRVLESRGKTVKYFCANPVPPELLFLPGAGRISSRLPEIAGDTAIVIIDTPNIDRVGWPEEIPPLIDNRNTINIDHHISNVNYAACNWINPGASCVGEMLFRLFTKASFTIDHDAAVCLYTSILTDTGGFRYPNTTAATFEVVAQLVKDSVNPSLIASQVYSSMPVQKYRLLNLALQTLNLHSDGRIGVMRITREMLEQAGASPLDADGFVQYPSTIKGVRVAVLTTELKDRTSVKISLRSKSERDDVNAIARKFGGGGHATASGCTVKGAIDQVEEIVISEAEKLLNQAPPGDHPCCL